MVTAVAPPALTEAVLGLGGVIVAASGGVDSLTLAVVCDRLLPGRCRLMHAVSPAVPQADTGRVRETAKALALDLTTLSTGECSDPVYLDNPVDRCRHCKTHLYAALAKSARRLADAGESAPFVVSGANVDDLGEYRPGLEAAREFGVRHPYIEAGMGKEAIRTLARALHLPFADLPASPCLASRVYTGTAITPERLAAVEYAEDIVRKDAGAAVVRCRVRDADMLVELRTEDLKKAGPALHAIVERLARDVPARFPCIATVSLDLEGYRPGRAFIQPA